MKIGLRTVKTAISAASAMIIAEKLGLLYAPSAGIISVLSVTSTKKTSVMTGIYRLLSLALATFSVYLFYFFGFYSDCFWYFFVIIYSSSCVFSII